VIVNGVTLFRESIVLSTKEVNCLGQVLDTTWGRSSTMGSPTMSMKGKLQGDVLTVIFTTIATFASNVAMSQQIPRLVDEGQKASNKYLTFIKDEYKDGCGKTLRTTKVSHDHSVEVISLQGHVSPKRTVLFRFTSMHEVK